MAEHNYLTKLYRMYDTGELPRSVGLHHVIVEHDSWCHLLTAQGLCNCSPDIRSGWSLPASADNCGGGDGET